MWGRAGRRGRGLAVYVAGEDALDQFFCRHPDEFLERPVEAAILEHENEQIHLAHLLCAAHEGPLEPRPTPRSSGPRWRAHAEACSARGRAASSAPRRVRAAPARGLPGRARVAAHRRRRDSVRGRRHRQRRAARHGRGRARVHRPSTTARSTCTWGAPTRSRELDLDGRRALVEPFDGNWYTQPKRETDTRDRAPARPPRRRSA